MADIVRNAIDYREANNVSRNDIIQLLMELRKADKAMTIERCAAHVAIFYLAGFENPAIVIAECLFELCRNPELMQKLLQEIDDVLAKHNDAISFDCVNEMSFLDRCVLGKF